MLVTEIYEKYQIMPQLQQHQLKVAAVAEIILDHLSLILDRREIIAACLLHDMGNIVKFDFEYTKKFMGGEVDLKALNFWEEVKARVIKKYGSDSHQATLKILKELNLEPRILELVDCVGFEEGKKNAAGSDFAKKICAYSDMRVELQGVVTLEERFKGLRHRYRNYSPGEHNREIFANALQEIEKQIFAKCVINPEDITRAAIEPFMEKLKEFEI